MILQTPDTCSNNLTATIQRYLETFCVQISNRHVGSPGNREATTFFANTMTSFGFTTECPEFDCIDWEFGDVTLFAGSERFQAQVSPYSPACRVTAPLLTVTTLAELEQTPLTGKIALLRGELTKEQLMPKNFPFYNPEMHQQIIRVLERQQPAAIIAATDRNPELAGGVYPFPLIEDGDFDLPSVYMTAEEGERLAAFEWQPVTLRFDSRRIPARGCNVIARKGPADAPKIVVCAHIDAKKGTPGALDNASGVAVLLALAELLREYAGSTQIELVALNGEDYYAASGQIQYLALNAETLEQVQIAINIDGAGYHDGRTAFSLYGCPPELVERIRQTFSTRPELYEGEAWPQGDHMMFVQSGRPALAITTEKFMDICTHITHTMNDQSALVDWGKLADVAYGLKDLLDILTNASGK